MLNIPRKGQQAKKGLMDKKIPAFLQPPPPPKASQIEKKPDPRDTTVALWDYVYKVSLPMLASRHVEDIKESGVHLSGDPDMDADIRSRQYLCYINIDKMLEFYREGVPIRVIDVKDTREIYDSISKHIYAWMEQVKHGVNVGGTPIDDLVLLDKFAGTVYQHAKHLFERDDYATLLSRHFGMGSLKAAFSNDSTSAFSTVESSENVDTSLAASGITIFKARTQVAQAPDVMPDRESLGTFFKERRQYIKRR